MDIVLATINATYAQTSLGLRYLWANMGNLKERATLKEFTISQQVPEMAERLLFEEPRIIALSLYIWNYSQTLQLITLLKKIEPGLVIIVGGPEVSYGFEHELVNHVIQGEGEVVFPDLCSSVLSNKRDLPKTIEAQQVDVSQVEYPYDLYSDSDISNRRIMVESSRGCPFGCQFCISSLDTKVRRFPLQSFLKELDKLWQRGARNFKFIDRTFNLDDATGLAVINFFVPLKDEGVSLHFEIVPDHLSETLLNAIQIFPKGAVQFEMGVQSFNAEVSERIGRNQNYERVEASILKTVSMGNIHIHADLIVGLPGEDLASFGKGFDRLRGLHPNEIQVGILKKLKGAPIAMHEKSFGLVFSPDEPYSILKTNHINYFDLRRMTRFARYWDLYGNSGNFKKSILRVGSFKEFLSFSDWLYKDCGQTHAISLERQARLLLKYNPSLYEDILIDYMGVKGRTLPPFLREERQNSGKGQKRQARHQS